MEIPPNKCRIVLLNQKAENPGTANNVNGEKMCFFFSLLVVFY